MVEYVQYRKGFDEDGQKCVFFQRVGGWCEPTNCFLSTHPFRAGELNPKHSRFSRLPALRDSACWSVKGRLRAAI